MEVWSGSLNRLWMMNTDGVEIMSISNETIVQEARRRWNAEADEYNQWSELGQDEKDEQIAFVKSLRVNQVLDKRQLRSLRPDVFWSPEDGLIDLLRQKDGPELADLEPEQLWHLIKERDRRFVQLWDKVAFERYHELTDYTPLRTSEM